MDEECRIAEANHGVITRTQSRETGVSDGQTERRLRTGRLDVIYPNVYRVVGSMPGPRQPLRVLHVTWDGVTDHPRPTLDRPAMLLGILGS